MARRLACVECGADFEHAKRGQAPKYCGADCRRAGEARRIREGRAAGRIKDVYTPSGPWTGSRVCRLCGVTFEAKSPRSAVCYSGACRARAHADRVRPYTQQRRATKLAAEAELFEPREVFERDGWQCQLCDELVDRERRFPDPLSASLDHVLPLSKGGSHTLDNVQLAHFSCNSAKGARVP